MSYYSTNDGPVLTGSGVSDASYGFVMPIFNGGSTTWDDASLYYQNGTANFYADFFHRHSVDGFAYCFVIIQWWSAMTTIIYSFIRV